MVESFAAIGNEENNGISVKDMSVIELNEKVITFTDELKVELIDFMGSDLSVVKAARVSIYGKEEKLDGAFGLITYLMRNRHGTPFEHNSLTFRIEAPIFVWREFHRHRIGFSYNEESGRYKTLEPKFYLPERGRVQEGKPGHYVYRELDVMGEGEKAVFDFARNEEMRKIMTEIGGNAYRLYAHMLDMGIAREMARMYLPVSIYSTCYVTCNVRSLMAFLSLRNTEMAMQEIRRVAMAMEQCMGDMFPMCHEAFITNGRIAP